MLPVTPHMQAGEILSSWMVRLSLANGFQIQTFYRGILGYMAPIWNRDIDLAPPAGLLETLTAATGEPIERITEASLVAHAAACDWVIPVGHQWRTRKHTGIQYCPLCLRNDEVPFYRRTWRLSLFAHCPTHHCMLENRCPRCDAPVAFHRHGIHAGHAMWRRRLSHCSCCSFNLARTNAWSDDNLVRSNEAIRDLEACMAGARRSAPFPQFEAADIPFDQALQVIIRLLRTSSGRKTFAPILYAHGTTQRRVGPNTAFEQLSAGERLTLLLSACHLLHNWPSNMRAARAHMKIHATHLFEAPNSWPIWLHAGFS